jgi:hypothetical protein
MTSHDEMTPELEVDETTSQPELEVTKARVDLKKCFTFDVGYSKPPRDSWYVKGTSGNPGGRPKGSKNKPRQLNDKNLTDILRDELFREVRVRGGRPGTLSAIRAVTQTMIDLAIGGNVRAIQLAFSTARAVEAADAAQQEADFKYASEYKARWEDPMRMMDAEPYRLMPVPDPDHVILDERNRRVMFAGPRNEDEMAKYLAGQNLEEEEAQAQPPESEEPMDREEPDEDAIDRETISMEPPPESRDTHADDEEEPRLRNSAQREAALT